MRFPALVRSSMSVLLCLALLFAGASGTHVHFCFDGTEPLASVQWQHAMTASAVPAHDDYDLALVRDAVSKKRTHGGDLPLICAITVLLLAWAAVTAPPLRRWDARPPLRPCPRYARPRLRAPPR